MRTGENKMKENSHNIRTLKNKRLIYTEMYTNVGKFRGNADMICKGFTENALCAK